MGDEHEDPRVVRSRACIVAAVFTLLREEGAGGVTVEGVAERAGVAKTTVYRLFRGRGELLLAAFEQSASAPEPPDTDDLRRDLIGFGTGLVAKLADEPWARALPALADESERDCAVEGLARDHSAQRRAPLVDRLAHAKAQGELLDSVDPELLAAQLVGPLFYCRFFTRTPIDAGQVEAMVDALLDGVTPPRR